MENTKYENKFNICVVGNSNVGKTCYIKRLLEESFVRSYKKTTGIETHQKSKKLNNKNYQFKIWDLCGSTRPYNISNDLFRTVDGFIYTFSINDLESFNDIKEWIDSTIAKKISLDNCILISMKSGLKEDTQINSDDIDRICKDYEIDYFDTSSKSNKNINESFEKITMKIFNKNTSSSDFKGFDDRNSMISDSKCLIF